MCQELANFGGLLAIAREWQIVRMQTAVQAGFKVPEQMQEEYRYRYRTRCRECPDDDLRNEIYKVFFQQFLADIYGTMEVPKVLEPLDLITIFGEICAGEYKKNLAGIYRTSQTRH